MNINEDIQKDLGKAKNRLIKIDIEISTLQKEKEIVSEKVWELGYYLEKINEEKKQNGK